MLVIGKDRLRHRTPPQPLGFAFRGGRGQLTPLQLHRKTRVRCDGLRGDFPIGHELCVRFKIGNIGGRLRQTEAFQARL